MKKKVGINPNIIKFTLNVNKLSMTSKSKGILKACHKKQNVVRVKIINNVDCENKESIGSWG